MKLLGQKCVLGNTGPFAAMSTRVFAVLPRPALPSATKLTAMPAAPALMKRSWDTNKGIVRLTESKKASLNKLAFCLRLASLQREATGFNAQ